MSKHKITLSKKAKLHVLAHGRCEYCKFLKKYSAAPFQGDHIDPVSKGGSNELENLAYICGYCNNDKSDKTQDFDPLTSQLAPLFHPRLQKWSDHFEWSKDKLFIVGKTPVGRATIVAMNLNRSAAVNLRRFTLRTGEHPPKED